MSTETLPSIHVLKLCIRLFAYAFRRWWGLVSVLSAMLLRAAIDVIKPLPMLVLVDNVIGGKALTGTAAQFAAVLPGAATIDGLLAWTVFSTVLIFSLGWVFDLAVEYSKIGFGKSMVFDLAEDMYRHLHRLSIRYHARHSVGDMIRRMTKDTTSVSTIINDALLPVPVSAFAILSMAAVMWRLDPTLTLLAMSVVPFLVACIWVYSGRMNVLSYRQAEAESRIYETVERTLSAMPAVQAFTMEAENDSEFAAATDSTLALTLRSNNVQLQFKVLIGLITALGTASIIWLGGMHVLQGTSTIGSILVFVAYVSALYGPLETLMYTALTVSQAAGSAQRVVEVLDSDPDVQDSPDAVSISGIKGEIEFENVVFGYEPNRPILNDVSLSVPAGSMLALVGHTGAGKSSLISLIPRFFDAWSGSVKIDGIDVRKIRLEDLRDQIATVLQEPFLFPTSVAENIAYGCPGATQEDIQKAAIAANAHEFIEMLPDGYSTVIGERGATLSGGERQRISIARALLKNAPILILDEPTSAIDSKTEAEILGALDRLTRNRTTIVIAHRLSTIRRADQIIVLENGTVAEQGRHDQLASAGGPYEKMLKNSDSGFPE